MKLHAFIILCSMAISLACEPEHDLSRRFTMEEGQHYSTPRVVQALQADALTFRARFNSSAIYHFDDQGFQDSKNKLLGFSDCNSLHHENSARFAWQWFNDQLEVYAYCYVDGERMEKLIGVVELDRYMNFKIELRQNEYAFYLNEQEPVTIPRGSTCDKGIYYLLWPYFGGTLPAPHDVWIDIIID